MSAYYLGISLVPSVGCSSRTKDALRGLRTGRSSPCLTQIFLATRRSSRAAVFLRLEKVPAEGWPVHAPLPLRARLLPSLTGATLPRLFIHAHPYVLDRWMTTEIHVKKDADLLERKEECVDCADSLELGWCLHWRGRRSGIDEEAPQER